MAAVIGSLVVGTDGSRTAAVAVGRAVALAQAFDAHLSIVSAYEPVPSGRLRGGMPEPPQDVEWARVGDAADAILDVAEEQRSDLVVVGNKGMTGATRFLLGSVPNKVSHHAPCSVLIVRTSS